MLQLLQLVVGRTQAVGRRAERAETPGRQEGLNASVAHPGARSDVGDGLEAPVQGEVEAEAVRSVSFGWLASATLERNADIATVLVQFLPVVASMHEVTRRRRRKLKGRELAGRCWVRLL